jgi:hypothetical protein
MNASGTEDFQFDNDAFDANNSIYLNGDGSAWAAERFDLAGTSTVNQGSNTKLPNPSPAKSHGAG